MAETWLACPDQRLLVGFMMTLTANLLFRRFFREIFGSYHGMS
jgi:hypothetical protein